VNTKLPTLVAALAVVATSCAGTGGAQENDKLDATPIKIPMAAEDPIGKLLADLDQAIARWSALTLAARTPAEKREQRMLQQFVEDRVSKRQPDLVLALEQGPPLNRMRAAAALGFSHSLDAQSPLLNALHDPDLDVVHNALLGLAIMARADTPLDDVCKLLEDAGDAQTRGQAAFAMRSIVQSGGGGECVLGAARRGLIDRSEPFVRSQCALTLGLIGDKDSVTPVIDLLLDDVPLVSSSAAEALVLIAKKEPSQKGTIARAFVDLYTTQKGVLKERVYAAMVQIADVNYGSDAQLWLEWAQRLP
jgi:HEAT repeat protein